MAFDPDQYLAEKVGVQAPTSGSSDFNPDSYLAEKGVATEHVTPTGLPKDQKVDQPIYDGGGQPFKELYPRSRFTTQGHYEQFHTAPVFGATPETYPYSVGGVPESTISEAAHTALPVAGLVAGDVASSPAEAVPVLGTAANMAAGAMGHALGERSADELDVLMGRKRPDEVRTVQDRLRGSSTVTGIANTIMTGVGGKVLDTVAAPFRDALNSAKAQQVISDAAANGIELTPAQITGSRGLSFLENLFTNNVFSGKYAKDARTKQIQQLVDQRERLLSKFTGENSSAGQEKLAEEIGSKIQKLTDEYVGMHVRSTSGAVNAIKDKFLEQAGSKEGYYDLGLASQELRARAIAQAQAEKNAIHAQADAITSPDLKLPIPDMELPKALDQVRQEVSLPIGSKLEDSPLNSIIRSVSEAIDTESANGALPGSSAPGFSFPQLKATKTQLGELASAEMDANNGRMTQMGRMYNILKDAVSKDIDNLLGHMKQFPQYEDAAAAQEAARVADVKYFALTEDPLLKKLANEKPDAIVNSIYGSEEGILRFQSIADKGLVDKLKQKATQMLFNGAEDSQTPAAVVRANLAKWKERATRIWSTKELAEIEAAAQAMEGKREMGTEIYLNPVMQNIIKTNPSAVIDSIVRPNEIGSINLIRQKLGQKTVDDVGRAFFPRLLTRGQLDETFNPKITEKLIHDYGDRTMDALYGPETMKEIKTFLRTADHVNSTTPVSPRTISIVGGLGVGALSLGFTMYRHPWSAPIVLGTLAIAPRMASKLYFDSPTTRKLLTEGLLTPKQSKRGAQVGTKLLMTLMQNLGAENEQSAANPR